MKPLEDIRIVAVEQYGAGPFGSLNLADLGAEVIKIEDPSVGGDVGRYVPPYSEDEDSLFFEAFNRNKRSISIDMNSKSGREVFEQLVAKSDAVYSNLRGDVPKKIGITYETLKEINPAIVCCSLTGFGMTGPRQKQPAYDYILQGIAGWMDLTGEPDGPPTKSGLSMVDYTGGLIAAISLLAGVHQARRDGVGMDCDVSLFDTAIALLTYPATWHLNRGFEPKRMRHSAHPSLVPFQAFEASDAWMVVGCAKEKFWQRLAQVIGRPELADDDRFRTFADRRENSEELLDILVTVFKTRTRDEWLTDLAEAGVPSSAVNNVAEALVDEQTVARNMVVETDHPRWGAVKAPASAVRVGDRPISHRRAPLRHEDAGYVLGEVLGLDEERQQALAKAGAFGAEPGAGASSA